MERAGKMFVFRFYASVNSLKDRKMFGLTGFCLFSLWMIYYKQGNGENMKRNRLMTAILTTSLILSGCAASEKNKDKKPNEKVSQSERSKSKSKKEEKLKEVKKATEEESQEQETQASQVQETPVATGISSMFIDDELFAFADETVNTFYAERMSYICGTQFSVGESSYRNDDGYYVAVSDPRIQTYDDIENVYYQKFSRRYPICYDKPYNLSPLTKLPFIVVDGQLYEAYSAICINGIGCKYTVGEIIKKTDDEFWVRLNNYCELDNSTNQTDIICSFVWEDGGCKYGDFNNPEFYKVG